MVLFATFHVCVVTGGSDDSDNEENKVTFSYKSKRQAEREGLEDMGATLTLETETKTKVCQIMMHGTLACLWL